MMLHGSRFLQALVLAFSLLGGLGAASHAQAVTTPPVLSTFDWVGSCSDCTSFGNPGNNIVSARLTLQNYTPGDDIDMGHFVSFSYFGSNLVNPYTVAVGVTQSREDGLFSADFAQVAGSIGAVPAPHRFELMFDDGLHFQTQPDGTWSTCAPGADYYSGTCFAFTFTTHSDYGTGGTFSAAPVPEPGVWAMLCAGLGLLAVVRRRRAVNSPMQVPALAHPLAS
jgi:PEP-CTERM motif